MALPLIILRIKELLAESQSLNKIDSLSTNHSLFLLLNEIHNLSIDSIDSSLFKEENLSVFEDLCLGKKITLNKNFQTLLKNVYQAMVKLGPGFGVRSILNSMISVCNNKIVTPTGRDLALDTIAFIIETRINDCAGQANDVLQIAIKLLKLPENSTKSSALTCLIALVSTNDGMLSDLYNEIIKVASKFLLDKNSDIRIKTFILYELIARFSQGFTIVSTDLLLPPSLKGMEDENAEVQYQASKVVSTFYHILIKSYYEKQEQNKIGAARGSDNENTPKKPAVVSRLSLTKLTSTKKLTDEQNDIKTVMENLFKLLLKGSMVLKTNYLLVVGFLIKEFLTQMTSDELEWIISTLLSIVEDPSIQSLSFEDQNLFRYKLSYIFRTFVIPYLSENQLIATCSQLSKMIAPSESSTKSDLTIQTILNEINHMLLVLGPGSVSLNEDIFNIITIHLRNATFGIRLIAATIHITLANITPSLAIDFIRTAMENIRVQMQQLSLTENDSSDVSYEDMGENTPLPSVNSKKKSPKEIEKLQRMYFFHGHTLVISLLMKNITSLSTGLPLNLLLEIFDLSTDLMNQDFSNIPTHSKHISCSIIRAGGLILSSCISMGYEITKHKLSSIFSVFSKLFKFNNSPVSMTSSGKSNTSSNNNNNNDDILYEIMCVESVILSITSLLYHCSETVIYKPEYLPVIIDLLETCFRNVKNKYQANYRAHFRFRTLHILLLECFTLLPSGSYPNSSQQIYVEALRVFRDSITNGLECSQLQLYSEEELLTIPDEFLKYIQAIPNYYQIQSSHISKNILSYLQIDLWVNNLQKKECETFLALFGQEIISLIPLVEYSTKSSTEITPNYFTNMKSTSIDKIILPFNAYSTTCIDNRTMDISIKLMAFTFPNQSAEYQDKALQLFAQALSQITAAQTVKKSSMSLFSYDDDQRIKKKEKQTYIAIKNILSSLNAIVENFPIHSGQFVEEEYAWRQTLIDHLYDLLMFPDYQIHCYAVRSLTKFLLKWKNSNMLNTLCNKMRTSIISSWEKKGDINALNTQLESYCGYILALGSLWPLATQQKDIQSLIQTTLFDCLRRADTNSNFQMHIFLALQSICIDYLKKISPYLFTSSSNNYHRSTSTFVPNTDELIDIFEKIMYAIEYSLPNVSTTTSISLSDDSNQLLLLSMFDLVTTALSLALSYPQHMNPNIKERLYALYNQLRLLTTNKTMSSRIPNHHPSLNLTNILQGIFLLVKSDREKKYFVRFDRILQELYLTSSNTFTIDHINAYLQTYAYILATAPNLIQNQSLLLIQSYALIEQSHFHYSQMISITASNSGLEYKSNYSSVEMLHSSRSIASLLQVFFSMVKSLLQYDIQHNFSTKFVYWVMFHRYLALGLQQTKQSSANSEELGERNNRDDDMDLGGEDDFGVPASTKTTSSSTGATKTQSSSDDKTSSYQSPLSPTPPILTLEHYSVTSYSEFISFYRDYINIYFHQQAHHLVSSNNILIKYIAVQSLSYLINISLPYLEEDRLQIQLHDSRVSIQSHLQGGNNTPAQLLSLPVYLSLFLTDVINLGSYFSTYTLNDKPVNILNTQALNILYRLVQLFIDVKDPDFVSSSTGTNSLSMENKILSQYLSQLLASVRVGYAVSNYPTLLVPANKLFLLLLQHGYIQDKVSLKRLLKPILTYWETNEDGNTNSIRLRTQNVQMDETCALLEKLSYAQILTQGLLLSSNTISFTSYVLDSSVKQILSQSFQLYTTKFINFWKNIMVDSMKLIVWFPPNDENGISQEFHPLRGGQTYSSLVNLDVVSKSYVEMGLVSALALTTNPVALTESIEELSLFLHTLLQFYPNITKFQNLSLADQQTFWNQYFAILKVLVSMPNIAIEWGEIFSLISQVKFQWSSSQFLTLMEIFIFAIENIEPTLNNLYLYWKIVLSWTSEQYPNYFLSSTSSSSFSSQDIIDHEEIDLFANMIDITQFNDSIFTLKAQPSSVIATTSLIKAWNYLLSFSLKIPNFSSKNIMIFALRFFQLNAYPLSKWHENVDNLMKILLEGIDITLGYLETLPSEEATTILQSECQHLLQFTTKLFIENTSSSLNTINWRFDEKSISLPFDFMFSIYSKLGQTLIKIYGDCQAIIQPTAFWSIISHAYQQGCTGGDQHSRLIYRTILSILISKHLIPSDQHNHIAKQWYYYLVAQFYFPCTLWILGNASTLAVNDIVDVQYIEDEIYAVKLLSAIISQYILTSSEDNSEKQEKILSVIFATLASIFGIYIPHVAMPGPQNYLISLGKLLTFIARSIPEAFKAQIINPALSDVSKQQIQAVMKLALVSEQQSTTNQSSSSSGPAMKINMDKYRKA